MYPMSLRLLVERVRMSVIGTRLVRGTMWAVAGALISRLLTLLASILVARWLGREGFGQLGIIQSTVGMFQAFAAFGLGATATKYVSELRGKDPARARRVIRLSSLVSVATGLVLSLALFINAPWLAARTLAAPQLAGMLRIGSAMLLLSSVCAAQNGVLAGFEKFQTIAVVNVVTGVASFPMMVVGVYWGGLTGAVIALTLNLLLNCILGNRCVAKAAGWSEARVTYRDVRAEFPVLWKFTLPAVLGGAVVGPVTWGCNTMLVNQHNGYAEMGILNAATQWYAAVLILPTLFASVLLPVLSERIGDRDVATARRLLFGTTKGILVVVSPLILGGSIVSSYILRLYGNGYSHARGALVVLLVTAGFSALQVPAAQVIAAADRMWMGFYTNIGWGLSSLAFAYLLSYRGAIGIADSRLIAYGIHFFVTFACALFLLRKERLGARQLAASADAYSSR